MAQRAGFIFSTGRTGTRFLASYFNGNYDNVLALHEPWPSHLLRVLSNAYARGVLPGSMLRLALTTLRQHTLRRSMGMDLYLEATPFIYGSAGVLKEWMPGALLIHVMRDPRVFVRSAHNHGSYTGAKGLLTRWMPYWFPPVGRPLFGGRRDSIWLAAAKWAYINRYLANIGQTYDRYHFVRFEDIFDESYSGLSQLADFLGLPPVSARPEVSPDKPVNRSSLHELGPWPTWTTEQARVVHELCSPLMQEHGYGLEEEWLAKIGED